MISRKSTDNCVTPGSRAPASGGLAAFRDARQQDQDQSVEKKRDHQRCGVAEAQVFHKEFERAEGYSRVREPCKFSPLLERAEDAQGNSNGAGHDRANHGEARRG
jgi:hypothetical protein